jgi:hypothetical protein
MFIQPDWWEVSEAWVGTNRYGYSAGDPVNGKDPGGHATRFTDMDGDGENETATHFSPDDPMHDALTCGCSAGRDYVRGWDRDWGGLRRAVGQATGSQYATFTGNGLTARFDPGYVSRQGFDPAQNWPTIPNAPVHVGPVVADRSVLANPTLREIWNTKGAQEALRMILEISQRDQVEYGFYFVRNPQNEKIEAFMGRPVVGGSNFINLGPPPRYAVGDVHTHWTEFDPWGRPLDAGPSVDDLRVGGNIGVPRLLVRWDGLVLGYNY